ncbi:MAG: hypothetical protein ABIG89_03840 [Candidatus Woesearchaeota archaeon]
MQDLSIFTKYNEKDYLVVKLDDTGRFPDMKPRDVAKIIIGASKDGKHPINFIVGSLDFYIENWHNKNDGFVNLEIIEQGYDIRMVTNHNINGDYYLLEKR